MKSKTKIKDGYTSINNKLVKDEDLPVWYEEYKKNQRLDKKLMYKTVTIKLNKETDADIIEYLQKQESITGFIRELIKEKKDREGK